MASNKTPQDLDPLISLGRDAKAGATTIGASVGLLHNTATAINTDLVALAGDPDADPAVVGSQATYIAAKSAKTAATAALDAALEAGFKIIATTVDVSKYYLGRQWNSAWNVIGFTDGSLAMPGDPVPTLLEIRGYFLVEGEREVPAQNVTAASAQGAANAITAARAASNTSKVTLATTKATRDGDQETLYQRLSGLRSELEELLGPDDPRWYAFGYARPADGEGPGPISTLNVDPVGPGALVAVWTHALRSDRSRVFVKILGTDPEPVQVASNVEGLTYTLLALPSGETVEVFIVPSNEAGDGKASPTVTIVVP